MKERIPTTPPQDRHSLRCVCVCCRQILKHSWCNKHDNLAEVRLRHRSPCTQCDVGTHSKTADATAISSCIACGPGKTQRSWASLRPQCKLHIASALPLTQRRWGDSIRGGCVSSVFFLPMAEHQDAVDCYAAQVRVHPATLTRDFLRRLTNGMW